jgi:hypothetical protein
MHARYIVAEKLIGDALKMHFDEPFVAVGCVIVIDGCKSRVRIILTIMPNWVFHGA